MPYRVKLDKVDRHILHELQENGRITNQELADKVNLSTAPCWRRHKRLEESGAIEHYTTILNSHKLGLNAMAFIHLSLTSHSDENIAEIDRFVEEADEVLECYTTTGSADYLIRVVAEDVYQLEHFLMKKLLKLKGIKSSNSALVLRQKKYKTALPLP